MEAIDRFKVIDNTTGEEVKGFVFVLNPQEDPAAAYALQQYISMTPDEELSSNLDGYLETMIMMKEVTLPKDCDYCGEPAPKLRGTPYMADGGAEMCKHCWDMTRSSGKKSEEVDIGDF
ncbi:hypothetical protein ACTHQ4_10380 [Alkalicoccobacillus gibsonii]|uniref:hypothetical protein n=1 Tax=Alkalicoccobacillus gibsonii TaxID=79881 RepID=UPI003F7B6888